MTRGGRDGCDEVFRLVSDCSDHLGQQRPGERSGLMSMCDRVSSTISRSQ